MLNINNDIERKTKTTTQKELKSSKQRHYIDIHTDNMRDNR